MKSIVLALIGVCSALSLYATHGLGGEMTFRQIAPNTVEASAHIYYKDGGAFTWRDSISISFGDGNVGYAVRYNGIDENGNGIPEGELIPGTDVRHSIYRAIHVYENTGEYVLSTSPVNRLDGIYNINFPNSGQVRFHIQATVRLTNDNTPNHSPLLFEPAVVDMGGADEIFRHTPNAFDPDGDSIVYRLIVPLHNVNNQVPNYDETLLETNIDLVTGMLEVEPSRSGIFVLAVEVITYRNGVVQDNLVRDMMIVINDFELKPPILSLSSLSTEQDVLVGDTIIIEAAALSQPFGNPVQLTCTGGLFEYFGNPATFDSLSAADLVDGTFEWIVEPEDLREAPYQIVFKARDDGSPYGLSTLIPIRFRVVEELTSARELNTGNHLRLFPNPATESLQISGLEHTGPVNYEIRAASGQLLQSGTVQQSGSPLNVSTLPKGWYVLTVLLPDGQQRPLPFIKQ